MYKSKKELFKHLYDDYEIDHLQEIVESLSVKQFENQKDYQRAINEIFFHWRCLNDDKIEQDYSDSQ
tara:strand:+ start:78 stop:278 length:201 start_codon:yes stop_codon:yes gene_type:complete